MAISNLPNLGLRLNTAKESIIENISGKKLKGTVEPMGATLAI